MVLRVARCGESDRARVSPSSDERFVQEMKIKLRMAAMASILGASLTLTSCLSGTNDATEGGEGGDAATFYEGKDITMLVPFEAGGGTDSTARLLAPILSDTIPGKPTVSVVNMPAAGGTAGSNEFALQVPHEEATTIYCSSASTLIPWLLQNPAFKLDYRDLVATGAVGVGNVYYANPETGVRNTRDFVEKGQNIQWTMGEQTPDSVAIVDLLVYDLLNMKHEVVFGFEGRGPARIAYEQGDIDFNLDVTPSWPDVEPLIESGDAAPLFSVGVLKDGEVVRDSNFPDLPHVGEIYEMMNGEPPSGVVWEAYKVAVDASFSLQKSFWLHQDAPPEAVEALGQGFAAARQDPRFKEGKEEVIGNYPMFVGEQAREATTNLLENLPEDAVNYMIDFLVEEHDLEDPRG